MDKTMILNGAIYDVTSVVAHRYGITNKTAALWVERGLLPPPVRLGGRSYFERSLVEQFVGRGENHKT
jgi:predicted site-specific integrase-resolvase